MKEIKFVDVGEGITEGHVQKWLVKDGDMVKEDQPVVQVETDKAVVNVPAPVSGKIKINVPDDSIVHVGDSLAMIGDESELKSAKPSAAPKPVTKEKAAPASAPKASSTEIIATPFVRKLARDSKVDISKVVGTGPGGRILENDVKAAMPGASAPQSAMPKFSEVLEEKHGDDVERVPMSQTRKAIARNMELSATIPRAVHMDKVNATDLFTIYSKEKENVQKKGVKLTFLPFVIKAVVEALKEYPRVNSSYDRDKQEVIVKKYYNIGLAAEAPDGLKVIVIRNADKKSIIELAKEIQVMHDKILNNTITIDEMRDSTFTITNIGSLGGGYFSVPMINYPEVAILGVHLIRDEAIVENGKIKAGKVLPLSLAFDHRVVDGADAALFTNAVKKYLEDPEFLEML